MKLSTLLAMAAILGPALSVAATPTAVKALRADIQVRGAKTVVAELRAGAAPQWDQVLGKIAQGGPDWLGAAGDLLGGTDAAAAEGVYGALSNALAANPAAVLIMLGPEAGIADVCFDRQIEPTPAQHQAFITRTRAALLTVKSPELRPKRDACLAKMGNI